MPATKAKPRSAKVAKAPNSRRRMARATTVPAKPTRSIENAAYYSAGQAAIRGLARPVGVSDRRGLHCITVSQPSH